MSLLKRTVVAISIVLVHRSSNVLALFILDTIEALQYAVDVALLYYDGGDGNRNIADNARNGSTRVKRQEISKYVTTSKMPPLKLLRIHLQMLKNFFSAPNKDIGGRHPMYHNVPKPIVDLFREHVYDFLFPEIGIDAKPDRSRQI